jgi:hypothetical protein
MNNTERKHLNLSNLLAWFSRYKAINVDMCHSLRVFIRFFQCKIVAPFYTFTKLRKATINFVMPVFPSVWDNMAITKRIVMKFDIYVFLEICRKN